MLAVAFTGVSYAPVSSQESVEFVVFCEAAEALSKKAARTRPLGEGVKENILYEDLVLVDQAGKLAYFQTGALTIFVLSGAVSQPCNMLAHRLTGSTSASAISYSMLMAVRPRSGTVLTAWSGVYARTVPGCQP